MPKTSLIATNIASFAHAQANAKDTQRQIEKISNFVDGRISALIDASRQGRQELITRFVPNAFKASVGRAIARLQNEESCSDPGIQTSTPTFPSDFHPSQDDVPDAILKRLNSNPGIQTNPKQINRDNCDDLENTPSRNQKIQTIVENFLAKRNDRDFKYQEAKDYIANHELDPRLSHLTQAILFKPLLKFLDAWIHNNSNILFAADFDAAIDTSSYNNISLALERMQSPELIDSLIGEVAAAKYKGNGRELDTRLELLAAMKTLPAVSKLSISRRLEELYIEGYGLFNSGSSTYFSDVCKALSKLESFNNPSPDFLSKANQAFDNAHNNPEAVIDTIDALSKTRLDAKQAFAGKIFKASLEIMKDPLPALIPDGVQDLDYREFIRSKCLALLCRFQNLGDKQLSAVVDLITNDQSSSYAKTLLLRQINDNEENLEYLDKISEAVVTSIKNKKHAPQADIQHQAIADSFSVLANIPLNKQTQNSFIFKLQSLEAFLTRWQEQTNGEDRLLKVYRQYYNALALKSSKALNNDDESRKQINRAKKSLLADALNHDTTSDIGNSCQRYCLQNLSIFGDDAAKDLLELEAHNQDNVFLKETINSQILSLGEKAIRPLLNAISSSESKEEFLSAFKKLFYLGIDKNQLLNSLNHYDNPLKRTALNIKLKGLLSFDKLSDKAFNQYFSSYMDRAVMAVKELHDYNIDGHRIRDLLHMQTKLMDARAIPKLVEYAGIKTKDQRMQERAILAQDLLRNLHYSPEYDLAA